MDILMLNQHQHQHQNSSTSSENASFDTSNQQNLSKIPNHSTTPLITKLKSVYHWLVEGRLSDARNEAHSIANEGRENEDQLAVEMAGNIWSVSDNLKKAQDALSQESFSEAKGYAAKAAELSRKLQFEGNVSTDDADRIIKASGGFWTIADKSEKEAKGKGASETPTVDQHRLNHERDWAFCGIATMLMVLKANGKNPPTQTRADVQRLAEGIYYTGSGTSGAGMAQRLRDNGLSNANYTTTGTLSQIISTLDQGQPVPLGIVHSEGTVVDLPSGGSSRYPNLRIGDSHYKKFGGSGHWLLVVGYEGDKKNPSAFLFNDPDVGGKLRVSKAGLEAMGVGNGNMWMVKQ
jgi:hypothetical protein